MIADRRAIDRFQRLSRTQAWVDVRRLRNQMVREYVEDPAVLAPALQAGHEFVPALAAAAERLVVKKTASSDS